MRLTQDTANFLKSVLTFMPAVQCNVCITKTPKGEQEYVSSNFEF